MKGKKPNLVAQYNKFKGGVDLADSNWSRYIPTFRNYKWTRAVVFALLKMGLVNSYIIYNSLKFEKPISQRMYLEKIIFAHFENKN